MSSEKLSSATDAVLVHSAPLPSDTVKVRGVLLPSPAHGAATTKPTTSDHSTKNDTTGQDRGDEAVVGVDSEDEVKRRASERAALVASTTQEVVAQSLAVGFQATNFGKAMEEMNRMLEHRHVVLNDDEEEALKAYINATTNAAATAAAQKLAATSTSGVSLAPGTAAVPLADGDNDGKKQEVASSPPPRPSWLPAEVAPKEGESFDKLLHCTNYCGVAANLMATGVRDACRFLAQEKLIDNYVVSAGGIEHDLRRLFRWHQYHVATQPQPPQHQSQSQEGNNAAAWTTQGGDDQWVKIDNIRFRAGPCPSPVLRSAVSTTTQSDDAQDASPPQRSLAEKTAAALRSVLDVRAMLASIEHYDSADARRAAAAAKSEAARARRLAARAAAQKTTAPQQQDEPPKEESATEAKAAEGDAEPVSLPRPESFIPTCCFEHCATVIIAQMLASPRLNYFIPGDDDDRNPRAPCFVRPGDALPADNTDAAESRVCFRPSAFWREFALRLAALHPVLPGLDESFTLTALLPETAMRELRPDATHTPPSISTTTKSTSSAAANAAPTPAPSAAADDASPYARRRVHAAFEATAASVFSPNFADGDVTGLIDAAEALLGHRRSAVCDLIGDISDLNRTAMRAQRTGMVVLGGGVIKHHVCNANLMRNGADHSVFLNTGQEFDGSDAGARPDEAVSWGKIRLTARPVKVYAEATVTVPMLVAQTAAPHVRRRREALGF